MRRIALIALAVLAAAAVIALPATGADDGPYEVRGYFDNGGFIAKDEEIRIAGARVGTVKSIDVSREDEIVSKENGGTAIPGKAVIVMQIDDDGFKDFREDASCIIRPASLIGEKYVDCTPTQPRAPGVEPPPELEKIADGERGEGERFLPLENNGKAVDLDLINNINRVPYRDRFRLILNDLGAGLAARGDDLGAIIDRANPALRQTNNVLNILAQQNEQLADLASNGDQVLEPLARNRTSVSGFFRNAAIAGEATAERSADLEEGLQKFPATLREVRLTMTKLRQFADQGTPLMTDVRVAAPYLSKATQKLAPFARATIPALDTLGDAAESAGPKLVASDGLLVDLRDQTQQLGPAAQSLSELLDTFVRTNGAQYLMDFIYNTVGTYNSFDSFGRFLRTNIQVTNCLEVASVVVQGCEAFYQDLTVENDSGKKKKKSKKSSAKFQGGVAPPPDPAVAEPETPATIEELIPELQPEDGEQPAEPVEPVEEPGDEGAEEPGAEDQADAQNAKQEAELRKLGLSDEQIEQMSWSDAALFLEFLLGGTP
jgi:phospholipid/cholesterol/gamma-HCH transport system substrate-binding protein